MSDTVTVRLTDDGPVRHRLGAQTFERGVATETSSVHADHLVERHDYFEKVNETCQVVKSDGEVCGRELPCGYHPDTDDSEESDE